MTDSKCYLSVVIPCYNEAEGLRELYRRVSEVCTNSVANDFEIVLVNDGSSDATWSVMNELCEISDSHVVAVDLSRNHGHQLALTAGLELCKGQRILVLDADLQDPPELLPEMLRAMDLGADVVYGQRIKREGETAFKKVTAYGFYRVLNRLVDVEIPRDTGDFRLMSRKALQILQSMPEQHRFIRGMVSWIGLKQVAIPYERAARFAGETKYPLSKMIKFAIDAITGFSIRPLRMASYFGAIFAILALLLLLYVVVNYFTGQQVHGWTSLAVIVLGIGSVQLLVAGVMGEYLGRLYMEAKKRPLFIIKEVVTHRPTSTSKSPEM